MYLFLPVRSFSVYGFYSPGAIWSIVSFLFVVLPDRNLVVLCLLCRDLVVR